MSFGENALFYKGASSKEEYRAQRVERARRKIDISGAEPGDEVEIYYRFEGQEVLVPLIGEFKIEIVRIRGRAEVLLFAVGDSQFIKVRNLGKIRVLKRAAGAVPYR